MNNSDTVRKDKTLIIMSMILGFLYFMTTFFYNHGIGTVIFFVCYYGIVLYAGKGNDNFSIKKGRIYFIPEIILLLCFLIYDNNILNFFNVPVMIILLTLHTAVMFSQNDTNNPVILFLKGFFQRPLENSDKIFKVAKEKTEKKRQGVMTGILIGVIIGIPIFTFVTVLLSSADQKFERILTNIINNIDFNIFRIFINIVFGILLSIFIFGGLYYNRHNKEKREIKNCKPLLINPVIGITILFMISISYIIYLALQFEYLFSAMAGKLPDMLIYSQYARNGFFELLVIAVLNFVLVTFFLSTGKSKMMKIASCGVSVITLLLIVSSLSKMVLYISKYDLTRLRVYTTWFMVTLFVVFVIIIVKIFNDKIKLLNVCLTVFTVMYLLLNILNTDSIIGKYNTDIYIKGNRENLDIEYISHLSDSGIVHLVNISEKNYKEASKVRDKLAERKYYINNKKDWQGFNLSTMILKEKLKNYKELNPRLIEDSTEIDNSKNFEIHIINETTQEFNQIECYESMGGKEISSFSVVPLDVDKFDINEDIAFNFYGIEENIEMEFNLVLNNGEKVICKPMIKNQWEEGGYYVYRLKGNIKDGFTLEEK